MIEELIAEPVAGVTQANTLKRHRIVPLRFASKRRRVTTNERCEQCTLRRTLRLRAYRAIRFTRCVVAYENAMRARRGKHNGD
jgi:hypothetical protein